MGLLGGFEGNVNSAKNKIANPFDQKVTPSFDGDDFPEGFKVDEILPNGKFGEKVVFSGNWMPKIPFTFGGTQRIKKQFYSGYSEPSMQVFGPEENDLTINGLFKDKRFKDPALKNISTEMQQLMDSIRIRGNVVRIRLGEFERYAIIKESMFDLERLSRVGYKITFSVIGFNAPKNAVFLQKRKEIPFDINKELIAAAQKFQESNSVIPDSVPRSIGDQIRSLTSDVASAIETVTSFVDQIFTTIQDVKSSVNRISGLIKHTQGTLRDYKKQVGAIDSFDPSISIAGRYESSKYASSNISFSSSLTSLLERLRLQFESIGTDLPLARHLVITNDTLQLIAIKFYGSSNDWKKIYDYNSLSTTELEEGLLLQIPRL